MKIKFVIFALVASGAFFSCNKSKKQNSWSLSSPDSSLSVIVSLNGSDKSLSYQVFSGNDTIIQTSPLGLVFDQYSFDKGLSFVSQAPQITIDESYTMMVGKAKSNRNNANEIAITFENAAKKQFNLILRAYNEGVAFKYSIEKTDTSSLTVLAEKTGFKIPKDSKAWLQMHGLSTEWGPAYEEFYTNGSQIGENAPDSSGWSYPALFQIPKTWLMITESDLDANYVGTRLAQNCDNNTYKIRFPLPTDGLGTGVHFPKVKSSFSTPWRVIMVSQSMEGIIESNLVHHLAKPQVGGDFSWVKPGRASWSWWGEHDSPKDFSRLKLYIDLAKELKWEYCLIDANWDLMTKGGNIEELCKYGNSQGVPLLLWYNSGGIHNVVTERPRDIMNDAVLRKQEFKKIRSWGVKAVKIDFFQSDKQEIIQEYLDILKDAAAEQIMVVFHGCTLPRGWARTYPNLVSMESVRGAEQYGWSADFAIKAAKHNTILACTRNVVGSMDYTPATFSDYEKSKHQTSNAHELALPIIFESGITHWADRVDSYKVQPNEIKEMMSAIPVSWDETKCISAQPGELVVFARKKDNQWFIAGINGDSISKTIQIYPTFLEDGPYQAFQYLDGKNARSIDVKNESVSKSDTMSFTMLPKGGFSVRLLK